MKAMILSAGLGTRLKPLSDYRPKPLFPVGDRPAVTYLFSLLKQYGIKEAIMNLHHRGDLIREELGDGNEFTLKITYSPEKKLLGTGGGVRKASSLWGADDILVINGDNILDVNLNKVYRHHQAAEAAATMLLKPRKADSSYTPVFLNREGLVSGIGSNGSGNGYIFTGVQILSPLFLSFLPKKGAAGLVSDGYRKVLRSRKKKAVIAAAITTGYWREISTLSGYWEANQDFLKGKLPSAFYRGREEFTRRGLHLGKGCRIGARVNFYSPVYLGNGCEIGEGTTLGGRVLIGTGGTVGKNCRLENVILWPGSSIEAGTNLKEAIVTPDVTIRREQFEASNQ